MRRSARMFVILVAGGLVTLITVLGPSTAPAALLNLGPEQIVLAGGGDLTVPGYSVPCFTDFNSDGINDLLVGEGGEMKDPETGQGLGTRRISVARLHVVDVKEKYSRTKIHGDTQKDPKIGDQVEPVRSNNAIAILPLVDSDNDARKGLGLKIVLNVDRQGIDHRTASFWHHVNATSCRLIKRQQGCGRMMKGRMMKRQSGTIVWTA